MRLSAIGDVAMCIPVIYSAARSNPGISFTVMTQPFLQSLFINAPANVHTMPIDIKGGQHSFPSLVKYASAIPSRRFDTVVDLHNVIRTRIIGLMLSLKGAKLFTLEKNRKERKQLVSGSGKISPLPPVISMYADTLHRAGIKFDISFTSLFAEKAPDMSVFTDMPWSARKFPSLTPPASAGKYRHFIGIAPFAAHDRKMWPLFKTEKLISLLSDRHDTCIYLFGSKGNEQKVLEDWQAKYSGVISMAGRAGLAAEVSLIATLDLIVSMDSANMHFASLAGTRVISVWGATHPYAGFLGFGQKEEDVVQAEGLACRPCSIFGQKPCRSGNMECMSMVTTDMVLKKIDAALKG